MSIYIFQISKNKTKKSQENKTKKAKKMKRTKIIFKNKNVV